MNLVMLECLFTLPCTGAGSQPLLNHERDSDIITGVAGDMRSWLRGLNQCLFVFKGRYKTNGIEDADGQYSVLILSIFTLDVTIG